MKEGWEYKKLGEIVEIKRGLTYSKNDEVESSNKIVLRSNNVNLDNHQFDLSELKYLKPDFEIPAEKYLQKGDLLMCMSNGSKAHLGKVALYEGENNKYAFGGFMAALSHNERVIGKYLFYAMITPMYKEYIKRLSDGANINNLKIKDIEAYTIPVPPLPEQERIVALLDDQFAKIDALKANTDQQLQAAKDLFQAALKELLTPKEGWKTRIIGEICEIARGGSPRPIEKFITNNPDGINWIKIGDTDPQGKYIYETKEKIIPEGIKRSRWVDVDDFILSNSMSFGRPYILKTNGCIHDGWLVIREYKSHMNIDFFYYLLTSPIVQKQFKTKAQGSTVSNLNTQRVFDVEISFPSIDEQIKIAHQLDALSEHVKQLQANYDQTINLCNDLKQSLLKSIFE